MSATQRDCVFPLLKAITPPIDGNGIPSVLVGFSVATPAPPVGADGPPRVGHSLAGGEPTGSGSLCRAAWLALLALTWLLAAMRRRSMGVVLVIQAIVSVALMSWMTIRYPFRPPHSRTSRAFVRPSLITSLQPPCPSRTPAMASLYCFPYGYLQWIDTFIPPAPDYGLPLENPLVPATNRLLETASIEHDRLWLVSEIAPYNPQDGVEPWLAEHGFAGKSTWFGEYRLESFTFSGSELHLDHSPHTFGHEQVLLLGHAVERGRKWLNVWLRWQALADGASDYTVTVQVLDSAGFLVAQHDGIPGGGFVPTSEWSAGQIVDDRHSVALPADLSPGCYRLVVAFYGLDGVRLPVLGEPEDAVGAHYRRPVCPSEESCNPSRAQLESMLGRLLRG